MYSLLWEDNTITNDFCNQQFDLEGFFKVLSVRPHIHVVQCDQVNDADDVTQVYLVAS